MPKTVRPERDPHRAVFFRSWLRDPFQVASVAPSSRWLAKLMATGVHAGACVVELGAGTGTLTTALLDPVSGRRICSSSSSTRISSRCCARAFRARTVVEADAATVTQLAARSARRVDYVISGLPILWFNRDKKAAILPRHSSS